MRDVATRRPSRERSLTVHVPAAAPDERASAVVLELSEDEPLEETGGPPASPGGS